jgi:hypothetical protein
MGAIRGGDIVCFLDSTGRFVVHRVVGVSGELGRQRLRVAGDAAGAPVPLDESAVVGVVRRVEHPLLTYDTEGIVGRRLSTAAVRRSRLLPVAAAVMRAAWRIWAGGAAVVQGRCSMRPRRRDDRIASVLLAAVAAVGFGCGSPAAIEDGGCAAGIDAGGGCGDDAEANASCAGNDPCGDHGTCDDSSGVVQCECDDGWGGEFCAECAAGWHDVGGVCVVDETCLPMSCDGHGACDDSTGIVACDCDTGYTGDYCDDCTSNYHFEEGDCVVDAECEAASCSFHGTCDDTTGMIECDCDDSWTGDHCEECAPGFHAVDVEIADAGADAGAAETTCAPDESCLPTSCAGHGACDDTSGLVVCACDTGYDGAHCDDCAAGYHWSDGSCTADER